MRISDWSSDVCSSDLCPSASDWRPPVVSEPGIHATGNRTTKQHDAICLGEVPATGRGRMVPGIHPTAPRDRRRGRGHDSAAGCDSRAPGRPGLAPVAMRTVWAPARSAHTDLDHQVPTAGRPYSTIHNTILLSRNPLPLVT